MGAETVDAKMVEVEMEGVPCDLGEGRDGAERVDGRTVVADHSQIFGRVVEVERSQDVDAMVHAVCLVVHR